jgi:hypothetical protein
MLRGCPKRQSLFISTQFESSYCPESEHDTFHPLVYKKNSNSDRNSSSSATGIHWANNLHSF